MYFCFKADSLPRVTCVNRIQVPDSWMHFSRIPEEYILYIINSGDMHLKEGDAKYHLRAGDFILLQPGILHTGIKPAACDYHYVHFHHLPLTPYDCSSLPVIADKIKQNRNLFYNCDPFNEELYEQAQVILPKESHIKDNSDRFQIDQLLKEAAKASDQKKEQYKLICSCKLLEVCTLLSAVTCESILNEPSGHTTARANKNFQQVISLLHSNYPHKITGSYIENETGMNFDYLNRIFKKRMGLTIFDYLNTVRINHAKELLLTSNMKSYEIAATVGFCDEYYFSKIFKKYVGISPSQYSRQEQ